MKRNIDCDACGFTGSLSYRQGEFNPSDISYCPACGGDISEEYNLSDDEIDSDTDSI